jgi:hypothetical protein
LLSLANTPSLTRTSARAIIVVAGRGDLVIRVVPRGQVGGNGYSVDDRALILPVVVVD